jgi:hypothetical protein
VWGGVVRVWVWGDEFVGWSLSDVVGVMCG